ncbi:MAG: peptidyl-prolyl cis-trans isomerase [Tepidisphaera sp.]
MHVHLTTTLGDIVIKLDAEKAPESAKNFLAYVDAGHYAGTIFHRVIPGFMIQGGGLTKDMVQKETRPGVVNEWKNGLKNVKGAVAMARLGGRPDSGTCQFFINTVDNDFLDRPQPDGAAYAVFGKVVSGMDTVEKIRNVPTGNKGQYGDVPKTAIEITGAKRLSDAEAKALVG